MARQHQPLQQRRRSESFLTEFFEHDIRDVVGRFQPHEIEQRKRSHRIAAPEFHALVDVFDIAHTFLESADGVEQIRNEQSIHYESRSIGSADGNFSQAGREFHRFIENALRRRDCADHFHELHQGHGIEKMHTDEAIDTLGCCHHLCND